jgi:hypothetical protein
MGDLTGTENIGPDDTLDRDYGSLLDHLWLWRVTTAPVRFTKVATSNTLAIGTYARPIEKPVMKQNTPSISVIAPRAKVRCRQATHVASPTKTIGTTSGTTPNPDTSENERYTNRGSGSEEEY